MTALGSYITSACFLLSTCNINMRERVPHETSPTSYFVSSETAPRRGRADPCVTNCSRFPSDRLWHVIKNVKITREAFEPRIRCDRQISRPGPLATERPGRGGRVQEVHVTFWDADSFCPISLQVLYITYSLGISLKYA